jgi:hypothetical protein
VLILGIQVDPWLFLEANLIILLWLLELQAIDGGIVENIQKSLPAQLDWINTTSGVA